MKTLRCVLYWKLLLLPQLLLAQPTLTAEKNALRDGDVVVKQQVKFVNPGRGGRLVIWDFGRLENVDEAYTVKHREYRSSEGKPYTVAIEHHTMYYYVRNDDSLLLMRQETPSSELTYALPDVQLTYPFAYGDKASGKFNGAGMYCRKQPIQVEGTTVVAADAYGMLVTPRGDTLYNTLRIKTTKAYNEVLRGSNSSIRVERYAWYAMGYRYPVFETVKTSTLRPGVQEAEHFGTAFYFPPQEQHLLPPDLVNEGERSISREEIFAYHSVYPNPCVSELAVEYNVGQAAKVYLGLYSQQGVLLRSVVNGQLQDFGSYAYNVSVSGLIPGLYLLKLQVGDRVLDKRIVKQ